MIYKIIRINDYFGIRCNLQLGRRGFSLVWNRGWSFKFGFDYQNYEDTRYFDLTLGKISLIYYPHHHWD